MLSVSRALFAASCLFAPLAAVAQEQPAAPKALVVTDCESFFKRLAFFNDSADHEKAEPIDGGCRGTDLYFESNSNNRWSFEEVRVTGEGLFEAANENRFPDVMTATITGMRSSYVVSSPNLAYRLQAMQRPNSMHLSYRWDRQSRDLVLHDFTWKHSEYGSLSLKGNMANLRDLPPINGRRPQDSEQMTINNISVRLDNRGLFERLVVSDLISKLPDDKDPKPVITQYQASATAFIDALPDTVAGADSRAVLKTFVTSFPNPVGVYEMSVETQPPVSLAEVIKAKDPVVLMNLFSQVKVSASHEPPQE